MNFANGEWILWLVGQVVVGAAIWGGIRSDIRHLHEKIAGLKESTDRAHERLDTLFGIGETNHGPRRRS